MDYTRISFKNIMQISLISVDLVFVHILLVTQKGSHTVFTV